MQPKPFLIKLLIIGILFVSFHQGSMGQAITPLPTLASVIPPSPTAAALGKFGEIPVGLYTGLPTISVPLYTAKNVTGDITVPITLNYHAAGIRVDDLGSWVGLGWSLECGGIVTRTIHGLPDDSPLGYQHQGGQNLVNYLNNTTTNQDLYLIQKDAAEGKTDLEPDIYSFSFAGHSGQFVFDRTGKAAIIPQQSLLIEARTDSSGIKITAEDGTIYQFLTPESSTAETIPNRKTPEVYDATWHLSRIEPPIGPQIKFVYSTPQDVLYQANVSENKQITVTVNNINAPAGLIRTLPSLTRVRASVVTLQHIQLANQRIDFFASARGDIAGASRLDSITVLDSEQNRVKHYNFAYQGSDRVFLTQVQEQLDEILVPPTKFTYNTTFLPPLYSTQQDHWGYYNANTASTLIPTTSVRIPATYDYNLVVAGADRSPDSLRMKSGILNSITYPTGGATTFDYEPHDYGHLNHVPTDTHTVFRVGGAHVRATQDGEISTAYFRLTSEQSVHFQIDIDNGETYTVEGGTRDGTFAEVTATYTCLSCTQSVKNGLIPVVENRNGLHNYDINLPAGNYRVDVSYTQFRAVGSGYGDLTATFQDSVRQEVNQMSGGLRIRRIVSQASPIAPKLIKTYKYRLSAEPDRSSGCSVSAIPDYYYPYAESTASNPDQVSAEQTTTYVTLTAISGGQLGTTQGATVGYSEVTVLEGLNGEGGKTVYTFTAADIYADYGDGNSFPFAPNNSFDYQRGQPLLTTKYRYDKGSYKVVTQIRYAYSLGSARTQQLAQQVEGLKFGYSKRFLGPTVFGWDEFASQRYHYTSEWVYPILKIERHYKQDGDTSAYQQIVTRYRYGNAIHKQLTSQEQTTSDGGRLIMLYRYPLDISIPTNVPLDEPSLGLNALVSKHILTNAVEQQSWRSHGADSVLVSSQLIYYKGIQPRQALQLTTASPIAASNFIAAIIQANGRFQQDSRYRSNIHFDQYDEWGHILQQRLTSGQSTSYLWGYHNSLPIAEIKNASYSEVSQQLQALGLNLASLTTESQLRDALQSLRKHLPHSLVSSYTHKPLIGLLSQTDSTGRVITYEYDKLGRLVRTRDEQGRILSQQQYHYAGK